MNYTALCGRLTADPKPGQGQTPSARFTLAVDRVVKGEADFIPCVAFNKVAENINGLCKKGVKIIVEGRIQTGSFQNREGGKTYTTDVIVQKFEFAEAKKFTANESLAEAKAGFKKVDRDHLPEFISDALDDPTLPFN